MKYNLLENQKPSAREMKTFSGVSVFAGNFSITYSRKWKHDNYPYKIINTSTGEFIDDCSSLDIACREILSLNQKEIEKKKGEGK